MESGKYDRTLTLVCPTCTCTDFEFSSEELEAIVNCNGCGREMTRAELIEGNSENIEAHKQEVISEVTKDFENKVQATLKKAFAGSRSFRLK